MANLRETRRARTAETIRRAAVDMAFEHGLDNITTEMISEKSGISPRTFFNYFPFKEAALLPAPLAFTDDDISRFVKGSGTLLQDVVQLLEPRFKADMLDKDHVIKAHEVSLRHPKLLALRISVFHEFDATLADLIARRLGETRDRMDVIHMAALITTSIRVGFCRWAEGDAGSEVEIVTARIAAIQTLFLGL